jgi:hypothetical protein
MISKTRKTIFIDCRKAQRIQRLMPGPGYECGYLRILFGG